MRKKNSIDHRSTKIGILKVIVWVFAAGALFCMFFLLTSYQVGPVKKMRGRVLLEYIGVIKDKRSDAELIQSLNSSDEIEQFNAISAMAYRRYSPDNAEALVSYLKSDTGTKRVKNIAVWALGELHAPEGKECLASLQGDEYYDQYEVQKAIKKIDGKIPKPFWRK